MDALAHQNIEVFAHYLYRLSGQPKGRARDHWERAEKELNQNIFREEYKILNLDRQKRSK
jgi:hypothetical protein